MVIFFSAPQYQELLLTERKYIDIGTSAAAMFAELLLICLLVYY